MASDKYNKSEKDEIKDIDELNDSIDNVIDFINNRKLLAPGISIDGKSHEGYEDWYYDTVTVTITDEVAKVNSKAKKIRYEITGAENKTDTIEIPEEGERAISFEIDTEGESTIKAYVIDERGKEVENKKEEVIKIDKTNPKIEIEKGEIGEDTIEIKIKSKEDITSKIKNYKYGIKGESDEEIKYSEETEEEQRIFEGTTGGKYTIKAVAIDNAGNVGESNEIEVVKQYTVSFDSNGGSDCTPITVNHSGKYGELPTPTRSNYIFKGWYDNETSENGTGNLVTEGTNIVKNEDHTLYAAWEKDYKVGDSVSADSGSDCIIYGQASTATCRLINKTVKGQTLSVSGNAIVANRACTVSIYAGCSKMHIHYDSKGTAHLYANINGGNREIWSKYISQDNTSNYGTITASLSKGSQLSFQVKTDQALQIYNFSCVVKVTALN